MDAIEKAEHFIYIEVQCVYMYLCYSPALLSSPLVHIILLASPISLSLHYTPLSLASHNKLPFPLHPPLPSPLPYTTNSLLPYTLPLPSPLIDSPQQTSFSPTPFHTPAHYPPPTPFHTPFFPLSTYFNIPPPPTFPLHCRISSSFPTCQVTMFTMGYQKHFGSELHVPTRKGKSSV